MYKAAFLIALICGAVGSQADASLQQDNQQDSQAEVRFPRTTPKSAETKDGQVTWPMRMGQGRPVPVIEANVNGQGPFLFYLDTGAGTTTLNTEFVNKLQLPVVGETNIRGPGAGPGIDADIVTVDRLQIGDVDVRDFEAAGFDRGQFSGGEDITGSLGLDVFGDLPVTLDFPNNRIVVGGDGLEEPNGETVLTCNFATPVPTFEVELGGETFSAAFDSGFAGVVLIGEESVKDFSFDGELRTIGRGRSVSGEVEIKGGQIEGNLKVGDQTTEKPMLTIMPVLLTDQEICVLGYAWCQEMAVTYDRKNGRVSFVKSQNGEDAAMHGDDSEYAGKYGMRSVFVQDGKLMYQRDGGLALELKSLGDDTFELTLPAGTRTATPLPNVRFDRDDDKQVKGFSLVRGDEVEEYVEKSND